MDLPLAAGEPDVPGEAVAFEDRPGGTTGTRVLVVDDNRDAAEMLAALLRAMRYDVCVAHDAASALEAAGRFDPQIALLDLGLPVIDGYDLARQLTGTRGAAGKLRLVAVTGYGQEADRRRTEEAGFTAHLVKPVTLEALTSALEAAASGKAAI